MPFWLRQHASGLRFPPATSPFLLGVAIATGATAGLVMTNPDRAEFQQFAGERLTELIRRELCHEDGLPMTLRLLIHDCDGLVASQSTVLGRLAMAHTLRRNFGIFSVYTTELGGQNILPNLRLPYFRAVTLAGAGHFVTLRTEQSVEGFSEP